MSELTDLSPSEARGPSKLAALAERMGRDAFARRLEMEHLLLQHHGKGQGKGMFTYEHKWDIHRFITFCLKISGLWGRAHRNYLDFEVVRREVPLKRLPAAFDGFRLLQLTDLHADLHPDFPDALIRAIQPLEYDLIVLTGDYRTCTFGDHTGATNAMRRIAQHFKTRAYAVLGNHDFIAKVVHLEDGRVRFLLNENTLLERDGARLFLLGIDDANHYKTHDIRHAAIGVDAGACKILLSHSPETYRQAEEEDIDYMLSGHTHGGQLCLPGGIPVVHDGTAPRRLLSGDWQHGKLLGYTSRGTGASGVPARLNCRPEITLHTLRKAE
ncbi:metallophosphoesterase [Coraliomargarita parva]|uniref:metallophosphoesterase n=1 Tax=Coraliomargarita parva TaxID=3014050 RepID=UPI0022B3B7F1|nr:metallophosphoesterase [Coraliomargarita parva]